MVKDHAAMVVRRLQELPDAASHNMGEIVCEIYFRGLLAKVSVDDQTFGATDVDVEELIHPPKYFKMIQSLNAKFKAIPSGVRRGRRSSTAWPLAKNAFQCFGP